MQNVSTKRRKGFTPTPQRGFSLPPCGSARVAWGFTLIETLIVIAIIAILGTIVFISLGSVRANARDAKRKVEISQIGRFLTLSCYLPDAGEGEYDLLQILSELRTKFPQYTDALSQTPKDPKSGTAAESFYKYQVADGGQKKCALYANLENEDEKVTLTSLSAPTPGGGTGVLEAPTEGWNGSAKYFQVSN